MADEGKETKKEAKGERSGEAPGYAEKLILWPNGFTWGVAKGETIVSYDICCHIPGIKEKEKFAKKMIKKMNA